MSTDNAHRVKELDLRLASALARMDEAAAGVLMADDIVWTHVNARRTNNKEAIFEPWRSGEGSYTTIEPYEPCEPYQHPAVCPPRGRVGDGNRIAARGLRHALAPPDQGIDHLQSHGQFAGGDTKIESTVCYLGVDVEDALTLAEHTEV